jgi:DNA-binding response OmpR family regulator
MTSTTPQILVVDDDPEIRKLLARYIEGQGFRVLLAATLPGTPGALGDASDRPDRA